MNIALNSVAEHGPATATALAKSLTIRILDMSNNSLSEYGPATAAALATSNTIHTVNMWWNALGSYAPETVKALLTSTALHTVYIKNNILREYTQATKDVFTDHNSQVIEKALLIKLLVYKPIGLTLDLVDMLGTYFSDIDSDLLT